MTTRYLLDTNVLSATAPDRRDPPAPDKERARAWLRANEDSLFLPATAIAEIAAGIGAREAGGAARHARDLADWLANLLRFHARRVLPFDAEAALHFRHLQRTAREHRATPGFADLTLAAVARAHGLVVATRNRRDFLPMGAAVLDPFEPPAPA